MKRPAWAIVPAKSLPHGKSRLRPVLGDEERARFARRLLEHVLDVLGACALDGVLVATDGDDVAVTRHVARGSRAAGSRRGLARGRRRPRAGRGRVARRGVGGGPHGRSAADRAAPTSALCSRPSTTTTSPSCATTSVSTPTRSPSPRPRRWRRASAAPTASPRTARRPRAAGLRAAVVDSERIAFDVDLPADHERLTAPRPAAGT